MKPVEKEVDVVLKFPEVDPLNPPVLTMSEVAFMYNKDKVIFDCINLNANLESRICIVSLSSYCRRTFLKRKHHLFRLAKMEPARQHC